MIEASINHEQGYVQSRELIDVYTTREPMNAFHQRIEFCLKVHNEAVKAMRYPPKKYNEDLETAQVRVKDMRVWECQPGLCRCRNVANASRKNSNMRRRWRMMKMIFKQIRRATRGLD